MAGRKKPMSADDLEDRAEQLTRRVSARAKTDDEEDDRGEPVVPPESKRIVLDDDEDEDDDGESSESERAPRTERRAERSRERGRIMRENEDLRRQLDEMRSRPPAPVVVHAPPQTQQKPPEDEAYERDMRSIVAESNQLETRSRQLSARKDAAGNVVGATPEEIASMQSEWAALEQRRIDLQVSRSMQRQGGGRQQGTSPEQVNAAILQGEYPDVFRVDAQGQASQALRWGHARHQQLLAEGQPNTLDTARKALAESRARFATAPAPRRAAPSSERKARYEGVSRGGGGSDSGDERPRSVTLTKQQMSMAEERYPNMKPDKAYKLFAERVILKKRDRERA